MRKLPVEIWLHITEFLPNDTLSELLGINQFFFNLAMDVRYREIELQDIPKAFKFLSQLQSSPTIAKRVRRLKVHLDQLGRLGDPTTNPHELFMVQDRPTIPLRQRLRSTLVNLRKRYSQRPSRVSLEALLEELTLILPTMSNIEAFLVYSWNIPHQRHDLVRFFSAAWSGFGATLRTLSLGGNIEGFKVIQASRPVLPALTELRFEFTDNMNPPTANSPEALAHAALIRTLLHDFVAPFVNDLSPHLEVLKLWSWASTDLSSFFKSLGPFPRLNALSVWAAFDRSFADNSSHLTEVLYQTSPTLKELMLRLNPTGSRFSDPQSELALCHWLSETVNNNEQFATGLRKLEVYPSASDVGLDTLITCISRSATTLEQLNVRDRYLFTPETIRIVTTFHTDARLTFLRLNLRELPVELFDLFAKYFPNLQTLALRAADGEPTAEFVTEIQTRRYHDWKLYDLTIWQGGNDLEYETMLLLAMCIPSVRSFWGQGNMLKL